MSPLRNLWAGLRALFQRDQVEREMDEELHGYLDAAVKDKIRSGMSREEALRVARVEMGSVDAVKEEIRSAGWESMLETFSQDIRYGLRSLRRTRAFTVVAALSLALGIGANSAIFSIVDSELLRPWPVKDPARLAMVTTERVKEPDSSLSSYLDYLDMRQQVSAFSDVVAYGERGAFVSSDGQRLGQELSVEVISHNYFAALGVRALRGRIFLPQPEEASAEGQSVMVGYNFWQHYFGGDPSLPGKAIILDGKEFTVIGIAPQAFCGLRSVGPPDIWLTKEGWETMVPGEDRWDAARDNRWFRLAGYLRPGAQLSEVRMQLDVLAKRLALASPATNQGITFLVRPTSERAHQGMETGIYLMAMAGLVLLISCANVAILLLARMERRQREIAMRRALGAGRRRLMNQLLTEGLLLSVAGGALGVLLATWLIRLGPTLLPALSDMNLRLDSRVLLFTTAISLFSTLIFGLAPALRAVKGDLTAALKGEIRKPMTVRLPLRSLLVCGEIALSVVLLAGSALLLRSLLYSQAIYPGFDSKKNVAMLSVAPPMLYGYDQAQAGALYRALAARVESIPGAVRVSYARRPPLTEAESGETQAMVIPGVLPPPGTDHFNIRYNIIAPNFFATIGDRIEKGRDFNEFDLPSTAPVVIINGDMARRFWPGQNPVGRSIRIEMKRYQIVGVVESGKYRNLHETTEPYLFLPFTQEFSFECVLFVETVGDPRSYLPGILKAAAAVDPHLPIVNAVTFREYTQEILAPERSMAQLLTGLSILGMFLAAVGLFATVAYLVSRRTHEIGVRLALGARRNDILRLVFTQGVRLSGAGAVVGLAGALAASRLMSQLIYGVSLTDPFSYAVAIIIAVAVALLACYIPARRATKVDPMVALRYE
ncbi:MAG TPA: ABC transporter permease [Terriglobia bacterium]|nr:ABC transporter permease [Terriglobia bacterium]